ncbi:ABC transporter permease [Ulvibacterium sp.]|uniref:ABC transporter permease n=1 Tax=Ulvibacterium sp. TaxID=2665914 RepID=UPI003BAC7E6D
MIKNNLKLAWRNLLKNKTFSLLNILGLASGLLCSILIYLWISDEVATDKHHENAERLFSVYERSFSDGKVNGYYNTPAHLHSELKLKFPEVEKASPSVSPITRNFSNGPKVFKQNGNYVSPDYFKMFSYKFIEGSAASAINTINDIAISKEMAVLFFGNAQNAMGKVLIYENSDRFQVSGVYELTGPSIMEGNDFFMHWDVFCRENSWTQSWNNNAPNTFIQLADKADAPSFEPKIKNFLADYNSNIGKDFNIELYLQPLGDRYLYSNFENGQIDGGRIENVRIFGLIAFFVLLMACINFMNLASAGSLKRAKEIGVRKVLGAKKHGLIYQFLSEAILLSLVSTIIALAFLMLIMPHFNNLTGKGISLSDLPIYTWLGILGVTLFTGLLAGSYPAFMLSSFRGIDIVSKKLRSDFGLKWVRQGLVVFQFSLSIILICGMLIVSKQIDFIQNKNLGFDKNNLLAFYLEGDLRNNFETYKNSALKLPGVKSISASLDSPVRIGGGTFSVIWPGKAENDRTQFVTVAASGDIIKTWDSKLLEGRDFRDSDQNFQYILNETAVKAMGLENPVGQPLSQWGMDGTIVGVIEDFHFDTIKTSIKPLIIRYALDHTGLGSVMVRIDPKNVRQTVASLESLHAELNPAFPFEYSFTDSEYDELYESETMFFTLSQYASLLAIFISCLGLFGLVLFMARQKVKEIGIRKVLGASDRRITILLASNFLKLVLLAIVIGSPIVWYLMDRWLGEFEYRIHMPWWSFGIAAMITLGIATFTLSFQSIKAANANPVKSLRTE